MQLAANTRANDWCWYAADTGDAAGPVLASGLGDALRANVFDLDASDLAFTPDEVDAAVVAALGEDSAPLATSLHELTSG